MCFGHHRGVTPESVAAVLAQLGGVATRERLLGLVPRRALASAVDAGAVHRIALGRYAVPGLDDGRTAAAALSGVLCLRSAALHHGWEVRTAPRRPCVAVPRGRRVSPARRRDVEVSWRRLGADDVVEGWVTTPVRTVLDCARLLPVEEGLAVADSALRHGAVTRADLEAEVSGLPPQHAARARLVLTHASHLAENPFESSLRATALQVPGTRFAPQHVVPVGDGLTFHPDVADPDLRIAVEAESFEFHGRRWQLSGDCRRYNQLVVRGWLVLRFAWEDVMYGVEWIRACVGAAVRIRRDGTLVSGGRPLLPDWVEDPRDPWGQWSSR